MSTRSGSHRLVLLAVLALAVSALAPATASAVSDTGSGARGLEVITIQSSAPPSHGCLLAQWRCLPDRRTAQSSPDRDKGFFPGYRKLAEEAPKKAKQARQEALEAMCLVAYVTPHALEPPAWFQEKEDELRHKKGRAVVLSRKWWENREPLEFWERAEARALEREIPALERLIRAAKRASGVWWGMECTTVLNRYF